MSKLRASRAPPVLDVAGVERRAGGHERGGSSWQPPKHKDARTFGAINLAMRGPFGRNDVHMVKAARSDYLAEEKEILSE